MHELTKHLVNPCSILFITLDSCRFDTFQAATTPNFSSIGRTYRAFAPGNFTYSSHAAMFMGFTPGVPDLREPFVNPKFGKIFKMTGAGGASPGQEFMTLRGRNVVHGLNVLGFKTVGTGAMGWFNPEVPTGQHLTEGFQRFLYTGDQWSLGRQVEFVEEAAAWAGGDPLFAFMNVGETHVPYYFAGAPWDRSVNPCVPFSSANDADECRRRQIACVEYADEVLGPLVRLFAGASTILCADHGDAWGEQGLWEHGIHHPMVLEVPLILNLNPLCGKLSRKMLK